MNTNGHPEVGGYLKVAFVLLVITVLEVSLPALPVQWVFGFGLMVLAAVKFWYVAQFFMHLKFDKNFLGGMFLAGVLLAWGTMAALLRLFDQDFTTPSRPAAATVALDGHSTGGGHGENGEQPADVPADPCPERVPFDVRLTAMEPMSFDLASITVPDCSRVRLTLVNDAVTFAHNFILLEEGAAMAVGTAGAMAGEEAEYVPDLPEVAWASTLVPTGATEVFEFDAPPIGVYDYLCSFPGHFITMQGTFTVE